MKAIITDLESGEETITNLKIPYKGDYDVSDPSEQDLFRSFREQALDDIMCNIYTLCFPAYFGKYCKETINETFILSPHADMVREEPWEEEHTLSSTLSWSMPNYEDIPANHILRSFIDANR
jgi:hypothetical protein